MNSENVSSNIAETDGVKKRNKRINVLMCAVSLILVGSVVVFGVVNSNEKGKTKKEYEEICGLYNETVEAYNTVIENYNALSGTVLSHGEEKGLGTYWEADFEQFENSESNMDALRDMLDAKTAELEQMHDEYNKVCLSAYNNAVEEYNVSAEKHNTLIERLSIYNIPDMPSEEVLKKTVTENFDTYYEKWANAYVINNEVEVLRGEIDRLEKQYYNVCLLAYNRVVADYNIVAEAYNALVKETSVHFIEDMQLSVELKEEFSAEQDSVIDEEELCSSLDEIMLETEVLIGDYLIAKQITNPSEEWVIERLRKVGGVVGTQAVTSGNDPNELLGKEGGYTSCVYFTVKDIQPSSIKGNSIVEKGTDAGGAIEVYSTLEHALNRCDYLSQFDGTLLYSGAYAVIGTMVVRTSYILDNARQVELTNGIVEAMTGVE